MENLTAEEKKKIDKKRAINLLKKIAIFCRWTFIVILGAFVGNFLYLPVADWYYGTSSEKSAEVESNHVIDESCTIMGINLHGTLLTYIPDYGENDSSFDPDVVASEDVVAIIRQANETENIKAILVEVDSSGGLPIAGEEISDAIKNSSKPVVALIRQTGASASYWAISNAKRIFASKNSDIGGIGVTGSYLSNVVKNQNDGYTYEQLNAGKYKNAGDPDKVLTNEEKSLFLRDINIIYNNFIKVVSDNRKLPIEKVKSLADGSTVLGEQAKAVGLIDEIGGIYEVEKYLDSLTGGKPEICW